jgi:hypothetical protein
MQNSTVDDVDEIMMENKTRGLRELLEESSSGLYTDVVILSKQNFKDVLPFSSGYCFLYGLLFALP